MSLHSGAPEKPRIIDEEDRPGPPPLMSEERSRGKSLTIIAAVLAVAAFAGVVWYAYDQGRRIGSETAAPLIKADNSPTKVRPDSPGGMKVPDQDKLVLDDLGSGRGAQTDDSRVERLLPPPETPVPAPEPLPSASSDSQSATAEIPPAKIESETSSESQASAEIPPATIPSATTTAETATEAPKTLVPPPAPAATEVPKAPVKQAPKPAETAAKTAPEPKPAPKTVPVGDYKIQIAALRSREAAEKEWKRVQAANKSVLGDLELSIEQVTTSNGVFFRAQGGPLTQDAAKKACVALKAKGQGCLPVKR